MAQKLLAEAVGTFFVTATAIGVDIFYYSDGHVDFVSRWLARGFISAAAIYAFAETSGAHLNPAVTLGFALRRIFPLPLTGAYVVAQFAGSFLAAALFLPHFGSAGLALGASHPGLHISQILAAICEMVLTFALVLVILMTAQEQATVGKQAALAVGFTIAACGLAAGSISGASMNPARTIAPQLLAGASENVWIYVAGPLAGSALAVGVHALLSGAPSKSARKAATGQQHPRA